MDKLEIAYDAEITLATSYVISNKCYGCCGSGNFLVIAYRELRKLELQALDALRDLEGGASLAFGFSTVISLSNFYGIEYADFAAETAKLALWIAEYQQNARFEVAFGTEIPALPLRDSGNILCNNALRVDWKSFCSVSLEQKVFLVGNPPYLGSGFMNGSQKEDMRTVFGDSIKNYKTLDYVTAWFYKGCEFIKGTNHELAFVATNSVSQGSQVETLWPSLFRKGLEIGFAHLSFKWSNNAANNAAVICVIIGMRIKSDSSKFLFNSEERRLVKNINGYLLEGPDVAIRAEKKPINGMPLMQKGNQPTDGGNLILSAKEKDEVIENWPDLSPYIKRIVGSKEIINGGHRFCFWFDEGDLEFVKAHPGLKARINAVTEMRLSSPDKGTQKLAEKPHLFRESRISTQTLGVPSVSSENRPYLPVEVYDSSTILTNLALAIYDAKLWHFALVASKLHYVWITTVCGRLKTDFRYSSTLGWHTFPVPSFNTTQIAQLEESAKNILIVRESHFPKTIAQLYDKSKFPEDLRQAHEANDALIEKMYRQSPFQNDSDRLEHLFKLYVDMTQGSTL